VFVLELVSEGASETSLPQFLDFLFEGLEGYVATATKRKDENDQIIFARQSFAWPSNKDTLVDWIITNGKSIDVYVAPAIFSKPSGKKEDFLASNVVWAEFDGTLPSTETMGTIPLPSLRLRSSNELNEHWYWKLDTPLSDASVIEGINRALTYQLGADSSGWDANQVLRPPSTYNHKREQLTYVSVISYNDSTVSQVTLDVLPAYDVTNVDVEVETIPDIQEVIFGYVWPQEVSDFFRSKVTNDDDRSAMLMRLGYYLAEMGLSDAEMFSVLRNADDRWGKFKDRTDRNRRLSDLIAKARIKYPREITLGEDTVPLFGTLSFLQTEIEISWIIDGLLQEQGYMLLTGPAGVGKTQFSLRVAINLALGRDFIDMKVERPCRILFWSLEMGHMDLKYFISTMAEDFNDEELMLLEQNLIIAPVGEAFYLDNAKGQQQFREIVDSLNVDGVFIDSVGSTTSGSISDEGTVKTLMDFNDSLRQSLGIFTWYIHHNRKAQGDNKKPNKLADVYGNQYLVNRATSVYCLWPNNKSIEVIPLKKRLAAVEDSWTISRVGNLDFKKGSNMTILQGGKDDDGLDLDENDPPNTDLGGF
jgi:hypothetical protein